MTVRQYTFISRRPLPLVLTVTPVQRCQIDVLAEQYYSDMMADGTAAMEACQDIPDLDLVDILNEELRESPYSALSMELKRRVKIRARELAEHTAERILVKD